MMGKITRGYIAIALDYRCFRPWNGYTQPELLRLAKTYTNIIK